MKTLYHHRTRSKGGQNVHNLLEVNAPIFAECAHYDGI